MEWRMNENPQKKFKNNNNNFFSLKKKKGLLGSP